MTNLTELKDGAFYYTINGIEEAHFCEVNGVPELVMPELEEVLAEVPDYIEWRNMVNCACEEHEANNRLIEENQKLKELLKECKKEMEKVQKNYGYDDSIVEILEPVTTKIDEVLK